MRRSPPSAAAASLYRRSFALGSTAAAWAVAGGRFAGAAEFRYLLGFSPPQEHPVNVSAVEMANEMKRLSDGRMEIAGLSEQHLGSDTRMVEQLRVGALQMSLQTGGNLSGVVPVAAIDNMGFAFRTSTDARAALDGELGAYIRGQIAAKGILVFEKTWPLGFREITTTSRPIRSAADMEGFKIRVPAGILGDLFKSLGASPVTLGADQLYTALQTHVADGQEMPLANIEGFHFYEIQKYLILTNHAWTSTWFVMNPDAFTKLPSNLQALLRRLADKYAGIEAAGSEALNRSLADKLRRRGMTVLTPDVESFRAKLREFYGRWKTEYGNAVWSLLERYAGRLA